MNISFININKKSILITLKDVIELKLTRLVSIYHALTLHKIKTQRINLLTPSKVNNFAKYHTLGIIV